MNVNGLACLYDRITLWQRISLLTAADSREDGPKYRRLFEASPLRTWRFPEHLLAEQALHVLALIYVGEQLVAATGYCFALWRMEHATDPRPEAWLCAAEARAYFFTANANAWRRFCGQLAIVPDALTAANHHGRMLRYCEETLPAGAPTRVAMEARFRETGRDVSQLVTADDLLASWQVLLQAMTRHAPRDGGKGER